MEIAEIKKRTIKSIVALTGRTVFLQLISFVAFFILGGYLSASAIGVFIAVSALLRFFTLFTDLGLGASLIQKHEDLETNDLSTTFTLQTLLVSLVAVIRFLLTPLVVSFAHLDSDGKTLYWVLLTTLFISSLKVIPSILLERKLAFERQVIPQIFESLTFNVVIVVLAYKGFGVASYSWAILLSALVGLPIYYLLSPWRISFGISWPRARHLIQYGISYQGKNVLAVIKDDFLTFFLTSLVGTSGIGHWGWAQRWAYSPFRLIVDSITKVTFPAYSRLQREKELLGQVLERSLFMTSFLVFPVLAEMMALVPKMLYLIPRYAKWEPAMASFIFLCLGAGVSSLSNLLVNVLDATGRVKTTLKLMILWIIATWVLTLVLVSRFGFTGIAVASFLVTTFIGITIHLVKQFVPFNFLRSIKGPTIAGLGALLVSAILVNRLPLSFLSIILSGLAGSIIYGVVILTLSKKELFLNWKSLRTAFQK